MKVICWPDAELSYQNGLYRLTELETLVLIDEFYADNQIDAICIGAARYGIFSITNQIRLQ